MKSGAKFLLVFPQNKGKNLKDFLKVSTSPRGALAPQRQSLWTFPKDGIGDLWLNLF